MLESMSSAAAHGREYEVSYYYSLLLKEHGEAKTQCQVETLPLSEK